MVLGIPKKIVIVVALVVGVLLIYLVGSGKHESQAQGSSPAPCQVVVTADILNVRAEPDLAATVVGQFERDTQTGAGTEVRNGYRKLADGRWAAERYLRPVGGCG